MIADGDEERLEHLIDLLEAEGARVTVTFTGKGVLQRITRNHVDLLLANASLEFLSGADLVQALRSNTLLKHLGIVFYSMGNDAHADPAAAVDRFVPIIDDFAPVIDAISSIALDRS